MEPGDTISFDVNVTNTGNAAGWIMIELKDHNNVCRDSTNITLSNGTWQIITLSTIAGDSERGDWTWYVLGYNDTITFFNISVSVSIHYNVSYSYNYILNYTSSLSYSSIGTNLFSYWLNWSALRGYSIVDSNDYSRIWGTKYGLSLYINDSLVYQESGATVYVLYINFIYNVTTAPWHDIPDDYVEIYDYDTGQLITSVYIPHGNSSVVLYTDRYYRVEIPSAGSTLHGYGFRLQKYVINGLENPPSFMASEDMVMDVYFEITNDTQSGDPATVTINTVARSTGVIVFNGVIYGGDEYYYTNKIVNGLIGVYNVSDNWVNIGSYSSVVVQYLDMATTLETAAGFYESGSYYFLGHAFPPGNGSGVRVVSGRFKTDPYAEDYEIDYIAQESFLPGSVSHSAKLIFHRGRVVCFIYDGRWISLVASTENTTLLTYVSYVVFVDSPPDRITVMRGDYIVFRAENLLAVEITGVDALGNDIHIIVGDNGPLDVNPTPHVIVIQEIPAFYPINGTIKLFFSTEPSESYKVPPIELPGYWLNMSWGNVSFSPGNNSFVDAIVALGSNPIGRYALAVIPLLLLLLPDKRFGVIMGFIAVALLAFFNTVLIMNGLPIIIAWDALAVSIVVLIFGLFYELRD